MKKSYHIVVNFTAAKKSYGRMATSYLTCDDFFANVAKEVSSTSYDFFANVAQQVSVTFDDFFVFHFIFLLSTVNFNAMS